MIKTTDFSELAIALACQIPQPQVIKGIITIPFHQFHAEAISGAKKLVEQAEEKGLTPKGFPPAIFDIIKDDSNAFKILGAFKPLFIGVNAFKSKNEMVNWFESRFQDHKDKINYRRLKSMIIYADEKEKPNIDNLLKDASTFNVELQPFIKAISERGTKFDAILMTNDSPDFLLKGFHLEFKSAHDAAAFTRMTYIAALSLGYEVDYYEGAVGEDTGLSINCWLVYENNAVLYYTIDQKNFADQSKNLLEFGFKGVRIPTKYVLNQLKSKLITTSLVTNNMDIVLDDSEFLELNPITTFTKKND